MAMRCPDRSPRHRRAALWPAYSLLGLTACIGGVDASNRGNERASLPYPCNQDGVDARCDQPCTTDDECGVALFCGAEHRCTAECVVGGAHCPSGLQCGDRGRCGAAFTVATEVSECARVQATVTPIVPTVVLLLDRSGSMSLSFDASRTRWESLREALVAPTSGVVPQLAQAIRFGASLFTTAGTTCPSLITVPPALDNTQAISSVLTNNGPGDFTPTAAAVAAAAAGFPATAADEPRVLVLATDGEPTGCGTGSIGDEQRAAVLAAVRSAHDVQRVTTYVLSVGTELADLHLQQVANVGSGRPATAPLGGANAPFYRATSPDALVAAFRTIARRARSCTFTLDREVTPSMAAGGDVRINGTEVPVNDADGWRLDDPRHVTFQGTTCELLRDLPSAAVVASFPCPGVD